MLVELLTERELRLLEAKTWVEYGWSYKLKIVRTYRQKVIWFDIPSSMIGHIKLQYYIFMSSYDLHII